MTSLQHSLRGRVRGPATAALPPKALRHWVRQEQIGVLEIKKRGVDVDPAELRRRLRLAGPNSATMVISRTPGGAIAAIVERV